ncbi:dermonecrotic toxin domain-containing protein [Pseudomonas fluorescens]|uniref:RING-type E3 ubiquitin transferase n=1 Tax=Pseudomonas fluorescens TaxID=294 RepID=A0A5E7BEU6_PSEFL|nr:DUF6543 domain-containing protein [Pseudomonas fluorescens]VVN84231.1 hypothetical protein PS710_01356 [Pseudomonas fluorescens]
MSDAPTPAQNTDKGRHYEFIKNTTSDTFKSATLSRGLALVATPMVVLPWYSIAPSLHAKLQAANLKAWGSQNKVDKLFTPLEDVRSFAAPLLQAELKKRYGIAHDVRTTYLHLYLPKDLPWYAIEVSGATTTRTISLLDAALHNFASTEKVLADSQFITEPDNRGHFDIIVLKDKMTIEQFQALCRELDIGALYKKHLESYLLPGEPVAEAVMQLRVTESLKDALTVAVQLALITGDLQVDACTLMLELVDGKSELLLDGRKMRCCDLSMMETRLTGILLLMPAVSNSRGIQRLIAYVPHDPDHPLKEYDSTEAFMNELTRQLREDKVGASSKQRYRQFFSQFIDQQQRGHFFAVLDQRLATVRWHEKGDPTDQSPTWRPDAETRPHLQFQHLPLSRDYWEHTYYKKLNKILNDAREIAVSTADTDSRARWAWWDNFKKIVSDIFNVALLVATPFVPGLGELMMAYTAYQMTHDVIEGIVDLAEGLGLEAAEHVIGVVTDVIQLVGFGAAAQIGSAFKLKLSPLVEGMKPVTLPDGKQTLWHPDLAPYEQKSLTLPAESKPNGIGLHRNANQDILPLEDKVFVVEKAWTEPTSSTHRIKHPTRPTAYSPRLEHNGHGAWVHELETPGDWQGETLMRRLGHRVDRFSSTELEQIRISSGTEEAVLRRTHVENTPPPPLLADTIKRFTAYDDVRIANANIRAGRPIDPTYIWFESIPTALPGWPSERALKVFGEADLTGNSRKYGNINATDANTLSISLAELTSGQLPERLTGFLNETEMTALLGREVPPTERPQALRNQLADAVDGLQRETAGYLYKAGEQSSKPEIRLLKQTFPDMPLTLAETLLTDATAAERQIMVDESRLPLRIKTLARELNFEADIARAYDGFFEDERVVPKTEEMALRTLYEFHSDRFADLRIDVMDGTYDGPLRCSVGPDDASTVRRLVRDEHGQYEVFDGHHDKIHEAGEFYQSILRALPADTRSALGYLPGQGSRLKLWIKERSASAGERRIIMAEPPIRRIVPVATQRHTGRLPWSSEPATPEKRVTNLYPTLSEQEAKTFVEALRAKGDPDQAIDRLKDELEELRATLQKWRQDQHPYMDAWDVVEPTSSLRDFNTNGGSHIHDRLLECFKRKSVAFGERSIHPEGGYTLDLSTELPGPKLDRWWKDLREQPQIKKFLDQVTVLNVDNTRFAPGTDGLLSDFPHIRHLSARYSSLTELPTGIGKMRLLETLRLSNNSIRLTAESAGQLRNLTRLETLRLDGNPLIHPLDVGRMPRLKVLSLRTTGLDAWPERLFKDGAFAKSRPRGFYLDLRGSPIQTIPEVAPGSDHALIVARTRLDTKNLHIDDLGRLGRYRESVGLAFEQAYDKAATDEISYWKSLPDDSDIYSAYTGVGTYRAESWDDLASEPGSEDFFKVIRRQRESKDYEDPASRKRLTKRVWQMIDAAALDSDLRNELFEMVHQPTRCPDAGSQLFNNMGLKVLLSKVRAESTSAQDLETSLVKLARSAARLEQVGEIARNEIISQREKHQGVELERSRLVALDPNHPDLNLSRLDYPAPDDVEVHLAYETGLAKRLDLPWQSEDLLYRARSRVDDKMIDIAYKKIIDSEAGDGLVEQMLDSFEHPFWEQHVRAAHPVEFEADNRLFKARHEQIEDLRIAQNALVHEKDSTQLAARRKTVEDLAKQLKVAQSEVLTGAEMSEQLYEQLLSTLNATRNALARKLTREAMARAGI